MGSSSQRLDIEDVGDVTIAKFIDKKILDENNIPQAWMYLRTVREPQVVAQALEKIDANNGLPENIDDCCWLAAICCPVPRVSLARSARARWH